MAKALVIVESPAKAKTISKYLGSGFVVESSIGHIRDLPSTAAEIPPEYKDEPWARLGVNVDRDFEPLYIIPKNKKPQVSKLKDKLKGAAELYLATDEDREGEAIAWHLAQVLKPKVPVKRMVFDEITKHAITSALAQTREIDERLVGAQEARRILDRLFGYEVSPVLWRKVRPKLSAGRVQSVATRLIVDRERARMRFVSASYWDVDAHLRKRGDGSAGIDTRLIELGGQRVASGKDFDESTGNLKEVDAVKLLDENQARRLAKHLEAAKFKVADVKEKPFTSRPYAPFITSTLQQEASRKLRFGAQRTMRLAQSLYENGYITYMRTDSTNLSTQAIGAARAQITELYGKDYLPESPRRYERKAKNAQEAHEAIRPAGESFRTPKSLAGTLEGDELRLYELIWKRTVASQMKDAEGVRTNIRVVADGGEWGEAVFSASGKVIKFAGFLRAYVEGSDDPEADL
jgi:DNA topoisomerase-1